MLEWSRVSGFVACDRGGRTVFGLLWFIVLVGICGLAVDTTNAFSNRTMFEATGGSATPPGTIGLPDESAVAAPSWATSSSSYKPVSGLDTHPSEEKLNAVAAADPLTDAEEAELIRKGWAAEH